MWGRVARAFTLLALLTLACGGKSVAPSTNEGGTPTTVSGDASGNADEHCGAPPDSGNCLEDTVAWYHELATGICRPFTYRGCGGNANRFPYLAACQTDCALTAPAYDACSRHSDCVIAPSICCLADSTSARSTSLLTTSATASSYRAA